MNPRSKFLRGGTHYTPEDYNVQETEENRAASQGAGPGLKKKRCKLDKIPHQADFTLKYSDPQVLRYSGNQVVRYSGTQVTSSHQASACGQLKPVV